MGRSSIHFDSNQAFLWLILAFSVHNLEEALFDLHGWMVLHTAQVSQIDTSTFQAALLVLTLCSWFVYMWFRIVSKGAVRHWVVNLVAAMLFANCFSHIVLSLKTQTLMPGVVSAIVLLGPLAIINMIHRSKQLSLRKLPISLLLIGGAGLQLAVPLALLPLMELFLVS